jgi:hypothetical protein
VATGSLNVATGSYSRSCILVKTTNKLHFLQQISLNFCDSKESVTTKVANVATKTFWLDGVGLMTAATFHMKLLQKYRVKIKKKI